MPTMFRLTYIWSEYMYIYSMCQERDINGKVLDSAYLLRD